MLAPEAAEQLRAEVTHKIKTHKPEKSNITKGERDALTNLKKKKDIVIIGADKGKATVVRSVPC